MCRCNWPGFGHRSDLHFRRAAPSRCPRCGTAGTGRHATRRPVGLYSGDHSNEHFTSRSTEKVQPWLPRWCAACFGAGRREASARTVRATWHHAGGELPRHDDHPRGVEDVGRPSRGRRPGLSGIRGSRRVEGQNRGAPVSPDWLRGRPRHHGRRGSNLSWHVRCD